MREKDIHELIEKQNPEKKQRMWEKISAELNLPPSSQPKAVAKKNNLKWAYVAAALVVVITLSIVLPITLKDDGVRYCDITQYETESLQQTLQECFIERNIDLLYVDWYDEAEELVTDYAYSKTDKSDIVFYREFIINSETGEELTLAVTDNKTRVDIFNDFYNGIEAVKTTIKNVSVDWKVDYVRTLAMFEFNKHTYYLELDGSQERMTEIIEAMLK